MWIVDPIDGTRAFLAGRPDWTVSVALVEDGRPRLAALYAPVTDEMFLAVSGKGATRNGAPIRVSAGDSLAGASIAGPKRYLDRLAGLDLGIAGQSQDPFAGAAARARGARGHSTPRSPRRAAMTGTLRRPTFWCTKPAALLTDFAGQPLQYNRPQVVHGALIAAGRPGTRR